MKLSHFESENALYHESQVVRSTGLLITGVELKKYFFLGLFSSLKNFQSRT